MVLSGLEILTSVDWPLWWAAVEYPQSAVLNVGLHWAAVQPPISRPLLLNFCFRADGACSKLWMNRILDSINAPPLVQVLRWCRIFLDIPTQ